MPLEWYDIELRERGFQVTWVRNSTPYWLSFDGNGLQGQVNFSSQDPPAEAAGERFVGSLTVTISK